MREITESLVQQIKQQISTERLLETAVKLVEIPSPTCDATEVANCLAEMLQQEGFPVERPEAGWSTAPAVVARYDTGKPGKTLQFNGHLDTVHLPFVPPRVEEGILYGSGVSDMKGGLAAAVEAMRVVRETSLLSGGGILLTAHDLHEAPWGDGSQVDQLIRGGYVGDAVMLPEYSSDRLSVIGRGLAILEVSVQREGGPVHEVLGGREEPDVIAAGAELVQRLQSLDVQLAEREHPVAGRESLFVGKINSGEIYNQSPTCFELSGTRRWLPGTDPSVVEAEFREVLAAVEQRPGITCEATFHFVRDAYELDPGHAAACSFQSACQAVMGEPLPESFKPFVDDGNTFYALAGIPAITHGPNALGAHTVEEEVPIEELVRVAQVYALTALAFCPG